MSKEVTLFEENRKKLIKKAVAVLGLVLIAIVAIVLVCMAIDKYKTEKYLESYGMTALEVGAYEVDFGTYRCLYLTYRDELKKEYTENGDTDTAALDKEIRSRISDDVRHMYAVISLAADHGYSLTSSDVISVADTYIAEMKAYCESSDMDFEKTLEDGYMNEDIFTFLLRSRALNDVLNVALVSDGGEIEDNDEKLLEIFNGDDMIRVLSVFIENDDGEDVEANRALALEVVEKYKGGADFNELIKKYSEDYYGDFYITRGEKIDVFDTAAFALDEGEISDVVTSDDGFYVILRVGKDAGYIEDNFDTLKSQYQYVRYNEKIEARMNSLAVSESAYVKSLSYEEIE